MNCVMKKIRIWLLGVLVMGILIFSCMLVGVFEVDRLNIADAQVHDWLEEIVKNEKRAPYFDKYLFLDVGTTRNSIICDPMWRSEIVVGNKPSGCAEIDGMKVFVFDYKIESSIPPVFEKTGKKMLAFFWSQFAMYECQGIFHLDIFRHADSYGRREQRYYKFIDGSWAESTWEDTYGEEMREEREQWEAEHIDTLDTSCAVPPVFAEKYTALTESDINTFIAEWEQWSDQLRTCSKDSLMNGLITKIHRDYRKDCDPDSCTFDSFNHYIEIRRYTGRFDDYPPHSVFPDKDAKWEMMMKASERYCYVPSTTMDRKILYMTPEIYRLLAVYLSGEDDSKTNLDRLALLRNYVHIDRGHWYGWHIYKMPIIYEIHLFDDGYAVDLRTSCSTGEIAFFPYDGGEKREIESWLE